MSHSIIADIALGMVTACGLGFLMKLLRQPLLLGYILAGVLIGPVGLRLVTDHSEIVTVSEIGLILLLFMIGLEIDLKKMLAAGRWVILPGLVQFPLSVAVGWGLFSLLESAGVDLGAGSYARLYAAIAISLSSTMIVVKLLFDKMEIDTLPGRITLGILVFQDIWAIIVLALQPNLNHPEVLGLLRTFGAGALLVGAALAASRFVLPFVFRRVAQVPELMLVISLGWCFLIALVAAHPWVGLSMEMGALIAGVALATFPYSLDVVAKAVSIRDFFITLFFVALGMQIPAPSLDILRDALLVVGVVLLARGAGVFLVLYSLRSGHRAANLVTINLAQLSEFSLVIVSLGIELGHVERDTLTLLLWVFSILAVLSTYGISYSHGLQRLGSRVLSALGLRDRVGPEAPASASQHHPVVLLGFFRIASAFLEEVTAAYPELLPELKIVDFNPQVKDKLDRLGVACVYGDIGHLDTLHHAGVGEAELVLSTIPDTFLTGTSNKRLLGAVRQLNPKARMVVTAETAGQARELYAAGADYVLEASQVAGGKLAAVVEQGRRGELLHLQELAVRSLQERREVLA